MNWVFKASIQKLVSALPAHEHVHYFLQRKVTKSLPISDDVFRNKVLIALKHLNHFAQYSPSPDLEKAGFLEFGAGWELVGPFINALMGVKNQTVVDISRHVRPALINDTLEKIQSQHDWISAQAGRNFSTDHLNRLGQTQPELEFLQDLGITYRSPLDMRTTDFAPNSVDFIINTSTLEHIPSKEIIQILAECYRILRPGALMSCVIDMTDHYAHSDSSITHYNFLKYSDTFWQLCNSRVHYQKRLRCSDYLDMFLASGFEIIHVDKFIERQSDVEILPTLNIDKKFRSKDLISDVAIGRLDILVAKT